MNPNDGLFGTLDAEQKLKILMVQAFAGLKPVAEPQEAPEPATEPEKPGWSRAQRIAFQRTLWAAERYHTWVVALIVERAVEPDCHQAIRPFAPEPKPAYSFGVSPGPFQAKVDELEPEQFEPVMLTNGQELIWMDPQRPSLDAPHRVYLKRPKREEVKP